MVGTIKLQKPYFLWAGLRKIQYFKEKDFYMKQTGIFILEICRQKNYHFLFVFSKKKNII